MRPSLYSQLERLNQTLSVPRVGAEAYTLGDAGLFLVEKEGPDGYYCSPTNADRFAYTDGDGTHFSFLHAPGLTPEQYPVVMTVPLSHYENTIVGGSLHEFLCLGCQFGYFPLESLAFRDGCEGSLDLIQSGKLALTDDPGSTAEDIEIESAFLAEMRRELNLTPWPNVRKRLAELKEQWLDKVILRPE